jgi:hypothetical protein
MPEVHIRSEEFLIALAQRQGLTLSVDEAVALRPRVEGLLARLTRLGEALPRDLAPLPTGGARFPR